MAEVVRFSLCEDAQCVAEHGEGHTHHDAWKAYWNALSPTQQQSIKDKARWEHMTLSAVAVEWGAPVEDVR